MPLTCQKTGITLEMERAGMWRFRSLEQAHYIAIENDGDMAVTFKMPDLSEEDDGAHATTWLRKTLTAALRSEGLAVHVQPASDETEKLSQLVPARMASNRAH